MCYAGESNAIVRPQPSGRTAQEGLTIHPFEQAKARGDDTSAFAPKSRIQTGHHTRIDEFLTVKSTGGDCP